MIEESESTYCASSQVTMGDSPIRYMRVKKERKVKMIGAYRNSHSSMIERTDCWGCLKKGCVSRFELKGFWAYRIDMI